MIAPGHRSSVVSIHSVWYEDGIYYFNGTRTLIEIDGKVRVLTAAHLVEEDVPMKARLEDGTEFEFDVWTAEANDVAFLTPKEAIEGNTLTLADADPEIGEDVYIIGHPSPGFEVYYYVLTEGIVNKYIDQPGLITFPDNTGDIMGISNDIRAGNSGSGVLDSFGRIVGIAVSGYINTATLNFAIPISIVRQELERFTS